MHPTDASTVRLIESQPQEEEKVNSDWDEMDSDEYHDGFMKLVDMERDYIAKTVPQRTTCWIMF